MRVDGGGGGRGSDCVNFHAQLKPFSMHSVAAVDCGSGSGSAALTFDPSSCCQAAETAHAPSDRPTLAFSCHFCISHNLFQFSFLIYSNAVHFLPLIHNARPCEMVDDIISPLMCGTRIRFLVLKTAKPDAKQFVDIEGKQVLHHLKR